MAAASPPTAVSNGELVRWTFEILNAHDVEALRQVWMDKTIAQTGDDVFDQMQFARQIGLRPPDASGADRAAKAAFNAKTRLLARVRGRRRR